MANECELWLWGGLCDVGKPRVPLASGPLVTPTARSSWHRGKRCQGLRCPCEGGAGGGGGWQIQACAKWRLLGSIQSPKGREGALVTGGRGESRPPTHGPAFSPQLQNALWSSPASGSPAGPCLVSPEGVPSQCMSPYSHSHGSVAGFVGVPASPGAPPGLYSLHGFSPALGDPSFEAAPDVDYKSPSLVSLRVKPKEPPSLLNWTT